MIPGNHIIKEVLQNYFEKKPVKRVWLFGSYARNEANEESDIDVLIELDLSKQIGIEYFVWREELTDLLKKKVQIVTSGGLHHLIAPFVNKDKQILYAREA